MNNPFDVQTPENLSTSEMAELFVQENTDYHQIQKAGHTFITGPRGAGKSMYFRYLEPDCQSNEKKVPLKDLDFYAAYIPIKETDLDLPELVRLQAAKHAAIILNEHALITQVTAKIFLSLKVRAPLPDDEKSISAFKNLLSVTLIRLLKRSGWKIEETHFENLDSFDELLDTLIILFDDIFSELNTYTRKLAFSREVEAYNGPLFGYSDFLAPLIQALKNLPFMPNGPFFLLIDDADNLNKSQTMILNSWVARRTTSYLCIKVSTQENEYKTYNAVGGQRIDAPHDYSDFNIADKYTTKSDSYKQRVTDIIALRLKKSGIDKTPEDFFPENDKQEKAIKSIADELRAKWENNEGRGFRANDDAIRYARPDYIKQLSAGGSKSGSTYSYAGFNQLVHLSSGIIRHVLETSSQMYATTYALPKTNTVEFIPPSIQDKILREYSDKLLFSDFEKLEMAERDTSIALDKPGQLRNLIDALGGMFSAILVSERSERRIFSIAFSTPPDDEVKSILQLGVKYGYFHRSTLGNKEGTGRVPLYIMTRRLAPTFKLDPTSFAGYKFVTNEKIKEALYRPKRFISEIQKQGVDTVMSENPQVGLFDDE